MAHWHKVAKASDIPVGEGKTVDVFGKAIALFNNNGTFQAIDNTCPHRSGSLGEGKLQDDCVVCPLHQWTFDLKTGKNIRNPQVQLKIYPVTVQGNDIFIEV